MPTSIRGRAHIVHPEKHGLEPTERMALLTFRLVQKRPSRSDLDGFPRTDLASSLGISSRWEGSRFFSAL